MADPTTRYPEGWDPEAPALTKEELEAVKKTSVTPRYDARFPNMNQAKHCWVKFVEFHKCMKSGVDEAICGKLQRQYLSICPTFMVRSLPTCIRFTSANMLGKLLTRCDTFDLLGWGGVRTCSDGCVGTC
jgi:cytochrome c oxidase subunit 6b